MKTAHIQAAAFAVMVLLLPSEARPDSGRPLREVVLGTISKWAPSMSEVPHVPYGDLADDISGVVTEEGAIGGPVDTLEKSAILLAGLGYFEGARFATYVDDGSCNAWMSEAMKHPIRRPDSKTGIVTLFPNYGVLPAGARVLIRHGDCDAGRAHSLWQVWPKGEFTPERLAIRREAARAALIIARASYKLRGDLSLLHGRACRRSPEGGREGSLRAAILAPVKKLLSRA